MGRFDFKKSRNRPEGYGGKAAQPNVPDAICVRCPGCGQMLFTQELEENQMVCGKCAHHFRLPARRRIAMTCDEGSFTEFDENVKSGDPLHFPGYAAKMRQARLHGWCDEVVTGRGTIEGEACCVFAMDPQFMMGSMGSAVGEKITRLFEYALREKLPVVGFTLSGGARMQEGMLSLVQMAKTSAAVKYHSDAGLLYITVLTDPTTGGVTASFAMEGDVLLAEPGTLAAFAGPRVIEQTLRQKLPKNFQRAEFLLEKGFLDAVVPRAKMKAVLAHILRLHSGHPQSAEDGNEESDGVREIAAAKTPPAAQKAAARSGKAPARKDAQDVLKAARAPGRPSGRMFIRGLCSDFIELRGDRRFGDDHAIIGGIGRIAGMPVTVIAQEKGADIEERSRRNFGMAHPEGYRKALRLMKQAEKFGRPVLCLVDTSGAFCGIGAEERGQGQAIAENLMEMMTLRVPVVTVLLGEGGSGGALALAVADRVWMMENSVYSVISPEGCASILYKNPGKAAEAAACLKITPPDLLGLGIIEEIIPEGDGQYRLLQGKLTECFGGLLRLSAAELCEQRYARFRRQGMYEEAPEGGGE